MAGDAQALPCHLPSLVLAQCDPRYCITRRGSLITAPMLRGPILRATAIPVLALNLLGACYRYVPMESTDIQVGGAYRGYLSPEGTQQVARLVGENVERFDGRVVSVLDTAYLVSMSATLKRSDERQTIWTGEQLLIPRAAVNRFELRQLDRPRTVRAAALYSTGLLAVGVLVFSVKGMVSGSPPAGGGPPPP